MKCKQCKGETDSDRYCSPATAKDNVKLEPCINKLAAQKVLSIAKVEGECYEYECKESIEGWTEKFGDWTFHKSCAEGSVSS